MCDVTHVTGYHGNHVLSLLNVLLFASAHILKVHCLLRDALDVTLQQAGHSPITGDVISLLNRETIASVICDLSG
jgi:hypothetical protein